MHGTSTTLALLKKRTALAEYGWSRRGAGHDVVCEGDEIALHRDLSGNGEKPGSFWFSRNAKTRALCILAHLKFEKSERSNFFETIFTDEKTQYCKADRHCLKCCGRCRSLF